MKKQFLALLLSFLMVTQMFVPVFAAPAMVSSVTSATEKVVSDSASEIASTSGTESLVTASIRPYTNEFGLMVDARDMTKAFGFDYEFDKENKAFFIYEEKHGTVALMHKATQFYSGENCFECSPFFYVENGVPMISADMFCRMFSGSYSYDEKSNTISIDKASVLFSKAHIVCDDNTIPLRVVPFSDDFGLNTGISDIAKAYGLEYSYNEEEKTVILTNDRFGDVILKIDGTSFTSNQGTFDCSPCVRLYDGVPIVSMEFFCQMYGAEYNYDEETNTIQILKNSGILGLGYGMGNLRSESSTSTATVTLNMPDGAPEGGVDVKLTLQPYYIKALYGVADYWYGNVSEIDNITFNQNETSKEITYDFGPYYVPKSETPWYNVNEGGNGYLITRRYLLGYEIPEYAESGNVKGIFNQHCNLIAEIGHNIPRKFSCNIYNNEKAPVGGLDVSLYTGEYKTNLWAYTYSYSSVAQIVSHIGDAHIPEGNSLVHYSFEHPKSKELLLLIYNAKNGEYGYLNEYNEFVSLGNKLPVYNTALPLHKKIDFSLSNKQDIYLDGVNEGVCGDNVTYTLDNSGTLTIFGNGKMADWSSTVYAPWYMQRAKIRKIIVTDGVTSIGNYAFQDCVNLETVETGNSVEKIGNNAFYNCASLSSISISDSLKFLCDYSFYNCKKLDNISLSSNIQTIGEYAFYECDSIQSITIPGSVLTIGNKAFYSCSNLSEFTITNGVKNIGEYAFASCSKLTSIEIPGSVQSIGKSAFEYCNNVASLTLNEGILTIGDGAFMSCNYITNLHIPASLQSIGSGAFAYTKIEFTTVDEKSAYFSNDEYGVLFNKSKSTLVFYPIGQTSVIYTIPYTITHIADGAFWDADELRKLIISNNIRHIGESAFDSCYNLSNVCYTGTEAEWNGIEIGDNNEDLLDAEFTFNYNINNTPKILYSGANGDNIIWTIDENGLLTFSGKGEMYRYGNKPWQKYSEFVNSLVIEDGITSICDSAFRNFDNLTNVYIGNDVYLIEEWAFNNCDKIESIIIPNSVTTMGRNVFQFCANLTNVTLSSSLLHIDNYSFYNCSKLESITIPDSVESIGERAFYNCNSLKNVILGKNIATIERYAFGYCNALTDIEFPSSLTSIGDYAFSNCSSLKNITIPSNVLSIGNGSFMNCTGSSKVKLENGIVSIGKEAFKNCKLITTISIPKSVSEIGNGAFGRCLALTKIVVDSDNEYFSNDSTGVLFNKDKTQLIQYPIGNSATSYQIAKSVTEIVDGAFEKSENLRIVSVYRTNTHFSHDSDGVLFNKDKTKLILCPAGTQLTEYILPSSVTEIGYYAFAWCKNLQTITLSDNLKTIGDGSFFYCCFDSITLPDSVEELGVYSFGYCKYLTDIKIPNQVTAIGDYAFYYCEELGSIELGENVTNIGTYAFGYCKKLSSIDFSSGVNSIGMYAFTNCTNLEDVELPVNLTIMEQTLFYNCSNLKNLKIYSNVKEINYNVCSGCNSLETVYFVGTQEQWNNIDIDINNAPLLNAEIIFLGEDKPEILYSGVCGDNLTWTLDENGLLTISGTGDMWDWEHCAYVPWFSYCDLIKSVVVEDGVTSIGSHAFEYCKNIALVKLPESVIFIRSNSFSNCDSLKSVEIPKGVETIESDAFAKCSNLTTVTIPASTIQIGDFAFYSCENLKSITVDIDNENYSNDNNGVLFDKEMKTLIQYPAGSTLRKFDIPYGVTSIAASAFISAKNLVNIVIPDSVDYIGYSAFNNCTSLTSVTIGKGITHIDNDTFRNCTALTSVEIPNGVISIGLYAFGFSKNLKKAVIPKSVTSIDKTAFEYTHEDFTIYGYIGSYAQTYANENDIPFVALDKCEKHEFIDWTTIKEPTCTESGMRESECENCGEKIQAYIPAMGHNYTSEVISELTCTVDGKIKYTCENCGDSYTIITKAEHDYEITSYVDATCTEDGKIVYTCTKCHDEYEKVIEAAHNYVPRVTKESEVGVPGEITYTCSVCGDSYTEELPALTEVDGYVLLVQDRIPWDSNDNTAVLNKLVSDGYIKGYDVTSSTLLARKSLDDYDVIIIANDQNSSTYSKLEKYNSLLEGYVTAGGVVIYGACDEGWADGSLEYNLPFGVTNNNSYNHYNYIVDTDHPVVKGALTDDKALTNDLLYGNYTSHTYFDASSLPEGTNIILQDGSARPTLAEYSVGDGMVIASGLTWEFYWYRPFYGAGKNTTYSKNVYDDLIVYALSVSGIEKCNHGYDEGVIVEPTCTTEGYTLHTCLACGKIMKDNFISAFGHTEGTWEVTKHPTCTEDGYKVMYCKVCDEEMDSETIEAQGHDTETTMLNNPTCGEFGIAQIKCKNCPYVEILTIYPREHEFDADNKCIHCGIHRYLITVHYLFEDGEEAAETVSEYYLENEAYSIYVPEIEGYKANMTVVSGSAVKNEEYTVVYSVIKAEKIVEIPDINIGNVEYNTLFTEIGLPDSVTAITEDGKAVSVRVLWNSSDYDGTKFGKQAITGTAHAVYGYEIVCDNQVNAYLNISENIIVDIPEMDLGKLPLGISYDGLGLPSTAAVITERGSTFYLPVEWDEYSYNSKIEGKHTIKGTIEIEEGFILAEDVENEARITFELTEKMYGTADIVFLIDTTGSMWDEIQNVKNNINMFADNLEADGVSSRWSLLEYRDITCDGKNSTKVIYNDSSEWYIDVNAYKRAIASLSVNGGGDREETVVDALKAATFLTDRADAVTFYIVVTDADFKVNNNYGISSMQQMINELVADETVASCVTKTTYYPDYRPLTDATGGILANIDGNFATELLKLKDLISDRIIYGNVTSIEITAQPSKTSYYSGDRFDGTGMIVTAHYDSGKTRQVTGYTVEPFGPLSIDDEVITVSYRGVNATVNISVETPMYPVTGVSVAPSSLDMRVGDIKHLKATVRPSNATNPEVIWETSNTNVVVVDESGTIEAVGEGTAEITAITADGGYTATVRISVEEYIPVTEILISSGSITLEAGDLYEIEYIIYPENATDKRVTWQSSDIDIATVNNGIITAHNEGSATITVSSSDTGVKASVLVNVIEKKPDFYTVTYHSEGDVTVPEQQTKKHGETITISDFIPVREGYEFEGWSARIGGAPLYASGDNYTEDRDINLYAVWVKVIKDDVSSYTLFNSGRTGEPLKYPGAVGNYDETSLTNGGYDLYARAYDTYVTPIRLGTAIKIDRPLTQNAILTILSHDVDENSGERDIIYLVDETDGTEVKLNGYLHGMNCQWNSTTIEIPASYFTAGHTYHFKLDESVKDWHIWVRNVTLQLTDVAPKDILEAKLDASIDAYGKVMTTLFIRTMNEKEYSVEFAAINNHNQYGSEFSSILCNESGAVKYNQFNLEKSAPKGNYSIIATVKDNFGDIIMTLRTDAVYDAFKVGYNLNGGGNTVPTDTNLYGYNEMVKVNFDVTPIRKNYIFMGWAFDKEAENADFTAKTVKTFKITKNTTLYAVWKFIEETTPVIEVDTATTFAGKTVSLDINVKNNPGLSGIKLELDYSDNLILSSVTKGSALSSLTYVPGKDINKKPYIMLYYSVSDDFTDGCIATLNFAVPEFTSTGTYQVDLECTECYDSKLNDVEFFVIDGAVVVTDVMIGDATGDNKVNVQDVILLSQYCAGWSSAIETINLDAVDTNADGRVNIQDVILLAQYCAGWDVTLG